MSAANTAPHTANETALKRFIAFFSAMSPQRIEAEGKAIYAANAYFNDTLKTLHGNEAIQRYLLKTARNAEEIKVDIDDTAHSDEGYYLRWRMMMRVKRLQGGKPLHSIGVSHIRFNDRGEVVHHQDYWDSGSNLFAHIPLLGSAIKAIKSRL